MIHSWRFGEVPKVLRAIWSFAPLPFIPSTQIEESGMVELVMATAEPTLWFAGLVFRENVNTPVLETRKESIAEPCNLKVKGSV